MDPDRIARWKGASKRARQEYVDTFKRLGAERRFTPFDLASPEEIGEIMDAIGSGLVRWQDVEDIRVAATALDARGLSREDDQRAKRLLALADRLAGILTKGNER